MKQFKTNFFFYIYLYFLKRLTCFFNEQTLIMAFELLDKKLISKIIAEPSERFFYLVIYIFYKRINIPQGRITK